MALSPPFVVRIEKQLGRSFGAIMNDIRAWLDHRKIEPISFEPVAKADRGVGFEIGFNSEDEAYLFDQEFNFVRMLEAQIPRLRRYARSLTRDASRADDLVQSCLTRAVAKQHLWQYGTDLRAWLFTILHNQRVNDVRRSMREGSHVVLEEGPELTVQSNAIPTLQLRDLEAALGKLRLEERQVILLIGLEGMRYDQVAEILNMPIGTVRSRLSRGRDRLRRLMGMEEKLIESGQRRAAAGSLIVGQSTPIQPIFGQRESPAVASGAPLGAIQFARPSSKRVGDNRRYKTKGGEPTHSPDQQLHHAAGFSAVSDSA
jgi:RNA polymerase sigma-70 factor, ECF subfamily